MSIEDLKNKESTEEDIFAALDVRSKSLKTNCETAASVLFEAITYFCVHRPKLVEKLLKYPVYPLYALGLKSGKDIAKWVKLMLEHNYLKCKGEEKEWLIHELPNHVDSLDKWLKYYKESNEQ